MSRRQGAHRFGASRAFAVSIVATAALLAGGAVAPLAQAPRTVQDGVFTEAQAARGQAAYTERCASCHGDAMQGAQAPPLVGDVFVGNWQTQPLSALANKIRNTMPADAAGTLTREQTADLVAYILKGSAFPASGTELPSAEAALSRITWPQRPAAAGAVAQAAGAGPRVYPPLGNMAQLMRGIFFPNSNLIFTVQTHDPGAPAPPRPAGSQPDAGFSWVDWGAGIYGGWQLVDNAAIALADASPLMLTPGLRCENGRPAPVTDPDWIRFTEQMIAVARRTYQASQSRNQETVSDITGDLSDACAACHQAYRDVRGSGRGGLNPADPSNQAGRCQPRPARSPVPPR
jgi:mono/diheme cytochrome c family protein